MTRFPHDRFAKEFFSDLLDPLGIIEPNRKVTDETREIDLFFTPTSSQEDPGQNSFLSLSLRTLSESGKELTVNC